MTKLPPKDDREAEDPHAAERDRKIAEREIHDKLTDNRKSVSLIAKLAIKATEKRNTKNAKKR